MYLALAGGVGGAKLAAGLAQLLPTDELNICVNTADDFSHLGLKICPDVDTIMYTLAGLADDKRGWGLKDETWCFMDQLEALGGDTWFQLGDRDLAVHVERTRLMAQGVTLSEVTEQFRRALGIETVIMPMSDDPVETVIHTKDGSLPFQRYFVERQCAPEVTGYEFSGIEAASMSPALDAVINNSQLRGVILCPSNPFVSIEPILSLPGMRRRLQSLAVPIVAVSPIIGGNALKGPAAKMFKELGCVASTVEVAKRYSDFLHGFVMDNIDRALAEDVRGMDIDVRVTDTIMRSHDDRASLAETVILFLQRLSAGRLDV